MTVVWLKNKHSLILNWMRFDQVQWCAHNGNGTKKTALKLFAQKFLSVLVFFRFFFVQRTFHWGSKLYVLKAISGISVEVIFKEKKIIQIADGFTIWKQKWHENMQGDKIVDKILAFWEDLANLLPRKVRCYSSGLT